MTEFSAIPAYTPTEDHFRETTTVILLFLVSRRGARHLVCLHFGALKGDFDHGPAVQSSSCAAPIEKNA